MAYDNTSFYGDIICDDYDEKNNFMNPVSPVGFFFYHILGDGFDTMSEMCNKFLNDLNILSADADSLDKFWGVSYKLPRPKLNEGTPNERLLTDDEYRVYLYLRNCRLITVEDILVNFNKCFVVEDYEVYISSETDFLQVVDHLNYESIEDVTSDLKKNTSDTGGHFITDFNNDEETKVIESMLSTVEETLHVVNIPSHNWDNEFLQFLEPYISIKGNIKIQEYYL